MINNILLLIRGTEVTLLISLSSILMGILLGFLLGLSKVINNKLLNSIANYYSNFFRGTPIIVQLFLVYFGLPSLLKINLDPVSAGVLTLALNSAAYISEILRGSIQSIDKGQREAGLSLGLTESQILFFIILPQSIKRSIPAICNELISIVKGSSIVSVIGLKELTREGQLIIARTYQSFEYWTVIAIIYFILTYILSKISKKLENKLND